MTITPQKKASGGAGWSARPVLLIAVVMAVGIMIACLASFVLQDRYGEAHQHDFSRAADAVTNSAQKNTTASLARVNDIANLIEVAGVPTRDGFERYLEEALKDQPWLGQVVLVERVPRAQLPVIARRERALSGEPFQPNVVNPNAREFAIITRTSEGVEDQIGKDAALLPYLTPRLEESARTRNAVYVPIPATLASAANLVSAQPNLIASDGRLLGGVVPVFSGEDSQPLGWLLVEFDVQEMLDVEPDSDLQVNLSPLATDRSDDAVALTEIDDGAANRLERSFTAGGMNWRVEVFSDQRAGISLAAIAVLLGGILISLIVGLLLVTWQRALHAREQLNQSERERRLDALTGLPNRLGVAEALAMALDEGGTHGNPAAVLFCDVDRFKVINDSLGHQVGDELLRIVAKRLRSSVRPADVVGRYGGDEFVVICPKVADITEARAIALRIAERVVTPIRLAGTEVEVSTSIGIAFAEPNADRSADELVRDADVAMYAAKNARTSIRVFDDGLRQTALDRLAIERALRTSLRGDGVRVEFQPIVDARRHTVKAMEALARFDDPVLQAAGPAQVIAVAEEIGVMDAVGDRVITQACAALAVWNTLRPDASPIGLSINVSDAQMRQPDFDVTVKRALRDNAIDAGQLILELNETAALSESGSTREVFNRLTRLGVHISVDDFGAGQSSLTQIAKMESISELKIDRSLVSGPGEARIRVLLLSAVGKIAEGLGTRLVAKGVETQEQLAAISASGIERAQGYLFAGPMSPSAAQELVRNPEARLRPQLITGAEPHPAVPSADA